MKSATPLSSSFLLPSSVLRTLFHFIVLFSNLSLPHIQSASPRGGISRRAKGGGNPPPWGRRFGRLEEKRKGRKKKRKKGKFEDLEI